MVGKKRHNTDVLESLQQGDLVEIKRGFYSHWAVYAGEGKLLHLAGDGNNGSATYSNSGCLFTICGRQFNKAFVKLDDFWEVVQDCKAIKNNFKDNEMSPATGEEIVKRGLAMLGEIGYNVLWYNCEHFASYCRYEKSESDQADSVIRWITACAFSIYTKTARVPTMLIMPAVSLVRAFWNSI